MFVQSKRAPNERELPLLEQWVAQLEPRADEGEIARHVTGWKAKLRSLLPGARHRRQLSGRLDRRRYDRAKAWLRAPVIEVTHVEAIQVALVCLETDSVYVFDIGDDRLFALDCEWFATDGATWPNSVFEIWCPARAHYLLGGAQLFCYGTELRVEPEYSWEEVERHARRINSGYCVCEVKEGVFPGKFENVLDAYARHVDNPPRRGWWFVRLSLL